LVTVDRPAKTGDFAQIDLVATIDGVEVDNATAISYEVGSGELLEGIDEALTLALENRPHRSSSARGEHEPEALVAVTITAVKERSPRVDDDFAQISSELTRLPIEGRSQKPGCTSETLGQLEAALGARPFSRWSKSDSNEVQRHLEGEDRLDDDEHRAKVTASSEKTFRTQILLDEVAEREDVKVSQDELTQYLVHSAAQYGMEPQEFVTALDQNGQIPAMVGEIARNKALAIILTVQKY
jgi:trigger factor